MDSIKDPEPVDNSGIRRKKAKSCMTLLIHSLGTRGCLQSASLLRGDSLSPLNSYLIVSDRTDRNHMATGKHETPPYANI